MADTEQAPVPDATGAGDQGDSKMETESAPSEGSSAGSEPEADAEPKPSVQPGPNAVDISSAQDGGLYKEIKKEGTGEVTPCPGDTVIVHYVGTLIDGTKFDSSRDRNEKFEFEIGKKKVIKGWDEGVATMKRGELAVLTCRFDYAYGDAGSPPTIPPKATLVFEVELFDWKGEDLSEGKDGGVLRSRLEKGEGFESPNDGATCEVHIVGKHEDRVFEDRDVTFVIGEGSEAGVVDGVDHAVKKFIRGEKSLLEVQAKYAYGGEGCPQHNIPAGADLSYEVTLKTFEKAKETWEMEAGEKLEQATLMKDRGTKFFKEGKYALAVKYYQKIISYLEQEDTLEGEDKEKKQTLLLAGHLNLAMCHLKTGHNLEAMHQCDQALELDENSEKGLFRRATAYMNMKSYEEAVADFQRVVELDAENKAAKNQLSVAKHQIRQQKEKEKQTYAGMFTKFAELDAKKQPPREEPKSEVIKEGEKKMENGEQNSADSEENKSEDSAADSEEKSEKSEEPMEEGTAVA